MNLSNTNWFILISCDRYPGEMHMVHYNSRYANFAEASRHSDGLAVLAIFLQVNTIFIIKLSSNNTSQITIQPIMVISWQRRTMRRWNRCWISSARSSKRAKKWLWPPNCHCASCCPTTLRTSIAISDRWPLPDVRRSSRGPSSIRPSPYLRIKYFFLFFFIFF